MWNASAQSQMDGEGYMTSATGGGGGGGGGTSFGESPSATQGTFNQVIRVCALPRNRESAKCRLGRRVVNIVPITVSLIMRGLQPDETVQIGNEKVGMVSLLGLIVSVEPTSTVVTFKIDDTTGPPIVIKQWVDQYSRQQKETADIMKPLVENCYAKVIGSVRTNSGAVYVVAHHVASLTSFNELTTHLLEVCYFKLLFERGIKPSDASGGITRSEPSTSFGNRSLGASSGSVAPQVSMDAITGLTAQQQMVFQAIKTNDTENGCSMSFLMNHLKSISPNVLRNTITSLSDEGHIYSTIDDEHFKATDI